MQRLIAPLGVFGFGVGCYGVLNYLGSYNDLMREPAIVAGPQMIEMSLQALLGFLLLAVVIGAVEITARLDRIAAATSAPAAAKAPERTGG